MSLSLTFCRHQKDGGLHNAGERLVTHESFIMVNKWETYEHGLVLSEP